MKTVLLAVDGSPCAQRATRFVADLLAGRPGVRLIVLNVQPPVMAWQVSAYVTAEMVNQIHERLGHDAIEPSRVLLDERAIPHERLQLTGEAGTVIAGVAKEENADLVVMGTRGHGTVASLVTGSVAMKVLHLVETPLTLVK